MSSKFQFIQLLSNSGTLAINNEQYEQFKQSDYLALKKSLESILTSLDEDVRTYRLNFQREKDYLHTKIRQKDEIIECMTKINRRLMDENERIKQTQSKIAKYFRQKMIKNEAKFDKERQKLTTILKYLEERNQKLIKQLKEVPKKKINPYPGFYLDNQSNFDLSSTLKKSSKSKERKLRKVASAAEIRLRQKRSHKLECPESEKKNSHKKVIKSTIFSVNTAEDHHEYSYMI